MASPGGCPTAWHLRVVELLTRCPASSRASVPREPGRRRIAFSDLASKVGCILLVTSTSPVLAARAFLVGRRVRERVDMI